MVNDSKIKSVVTIIIGVVVVLALVAGLAPAGQTEGDKLTDSGRCSSAGGTYNSTSSTCWTDANENVTQGYTQTPLGSLFGGTSVIFIALMGGLLAGAVALVMKFKKK